MSQSFSLSRSQRGILYMVLASLLFSTGGAGSQMV